MEHFTSFDGLELAYLDVGAGEPVILLHGFAADHFSNWVATGVVDALVDARSTRARSGRARSRGVGQAARPGGVRQRRHGSRRAVAHGSRGGRALDVVGYSMGSIVAGRLRPA